MLIFQGVRTFFLVGFFPVLDGKQEGQIHVEASPTLECLGWQLQLHNFWVSLGGGNSNMFGIFTPWALGKWSQFNLMFAYFFRWVVWNHQLVLRFGSKNSYEQTGRPLWLYQYHGEQTHCFNNLVFCLQWRRIYIWCGNIKDDIVIYRRI